MAWPVYVNAKCENDTVGQRLAYKVREGLRKSESMKLIETYQNSLIQLYLTCLDAEPNLRGIVSQYSYSITLFNSKGLYDFQLTSGVGKCGTDRVDPCAESLVAALDDQINSVISNIKNGDFKLTD